MNAREYREKLIDEVKKYPVLYDTNHENHRDIDVRDRCWQEISERLGANSEYCSSLITRLKIKWQVTAKLHNIVGDKRLYCYELSDGFAWH